MWQVYLYLANERHHDEYREQVLRRPEGGSRIRRWRTARRPSSPAETQRPGVTTR
jgi:hypothetical protein